MSKITTRCCIVGGGPAGVMVGFLLARAGVDVYVLEKWDDFFRDFRGDTIHPSTFELLHDLGILDEFLKIPHNETYQLAAEIGGKQVIIADFSHLKVHCPFIGFIPQWNFLNFMVEHAKKYPTFHLLMGTQAIDLIKEDGRIVGVLAKSAQEEFEIRAELVVGADGRHSTIREKSRLEVQTLSAPMDVLWFRISRKATDAKQSMGKIDYGRIIIMIERGDYWQCGFLIRKGGYDNIVKQGIEAFRQNILEVAPMFDDRVNEITSWDQIKLLTVVVDYLKKWHLPGLICIGDSAHAMSPIGGVGINLAVQDAVAAANILVPAFTNDVVTEDNLAAIQKRRTFPTKIIQRIQVFIQNKIIDHVLDNRVRPQLPFAMKILQHIPYLRKIPAYLVGIGVRPERIQTPDFFNQ